MCKKLCKSAALALSRFCSLILTGNDGNPLKNTGQRRHKQQEDGCSYTLLRYALIGLSNVLLKLFGLILSASRKRHQTFSACLRAVGHLYQQRPFLFGFVDRALDCGLKLLLIVGADSPKTHRQGQPAAYPVLFEPV